MTDDAATPETPAPKLDFDPVPALVQTLSLPAKGVAAVIALLDEGNTVPFIARYRTERSRTSTRRIGRAARRAHRSPASVGSSHSHTKSSRKPPTVTPPPRQRPS